MNAHLPNKITAARLKLYPEQRAGGFTRRDGTIAFYSRVNALLAPGHVLLDYGAGRGRGGEDKCEYRRNLLRLRDKVGKVIGVDVDEAVLTNPNLDEAKVISPVGPIDLPSGSFDIIIADWVLEHIDRPEQFCEEVDRLLRPGGWFCARTPNKWGITGLGARLTPNRMHTKMLKVLTDGRQALDVFPTRYRLNTLSALRGYFPPEGWYDASYVENAEPPYVVRSRTAARLIQLYWRLTPGLLHTNLHIFMQKRTAENAPAQRGNGGPDAVPLP